MHDVDIIKERLQSVLPDLMFEKLKCAHPVDDDGLWFLRYPGRADELQMESGTYNLPFIIESSNGKEPRTVHTIEEAVNTVLTHFR